MARDNKDELGKYKEDFTSPIDLDLMSEDAVTLECGHNLLKSELDQIRTSASTFNARRQHYQEERHPTCPLCPTLIKEDFNPQENKLIKRSIEIVAELVGETRKLQAEKVELEATHQQAIEQLKAEAQAAEGNHKLKAAKESVEAASKTILEQRKEIAALREEAKRAGTEKESALAEKATVEKERDDLQTKNTEQADKISQLEQQVKDLEKTQRKADKKERQEKSRADKIEELEKKLAAANAKINELEESPNYDKAPAFTQGSTRQISAQSQRKNKQDKKRNKSFAAQSQPQTALSSSQQPHQEEKIDESERKRVSQLTPEERAIELSLLEAAKAQKKRIDEFNSAGLEDADRFSADDAAVPSSSSSSSSNSSFSSSSSSSRNSSSSSSSSSPSSSSSASASSTSPPLLSDLPEKPTLVVNKDADINSDWVEDIVMGVISAEPRLDLNEGESFSEGRPIAPAASVEEDKADSKDDRPAMSTEEELVDLNRCLNLTHHTFISAAQKKQEATFIHALIKLKAGHDLNDPTSLQLLINTTQKIIALLEAEKSAPPATSQLADQPEAEKPKLSANQKKRQSKKKKKGPAKKKANLEFYQAHVRAVLEETQATYRQLMNPSGLSSADLNKAKFGPEIPEDLEDKKDDAAEHVVASFDSANIAAFALMEQATANKEKDFRGVLSNFFFPNPPFESLEKLYVSMVARLQNELPAEKAEHYKELMDQEYILLAEQYVTGKEHTRDLLKSKQLYAFIASKSKDPIIQERYTEKVEEKDALYRAYKNAGYFIGLLYAGGALSFQPSWEATFTRNANNQISNVLAIGESLLLLVAHSKPSIPPEDIKNCKALLANSYYDLAESYETGSGGRVIDLEKARLLYQFAGNKTGCAQSQRKIAEFYKEGKGGVGVDKRKADIALKLAEKIERESEFDAPQKAPESQINKAKEAINFVELTAKEVCDFKQYVLDFISQNYNNPKLLEEFARDRIYQIRALPSNLPREKIRAYEKALTEAYCEKGLEFDSQDFVDENDFKIIKHLYFIAATYHSAEGQYQLARCYHQGSDAEVCYGDALTYYTKAARRGHEGALKALQEFRPPVAARPPSPLTSVSVSPLPPSPAPQPSSAPAASNAASPNDAEKKDSDEDLLPLEEQDDAASLLFSMEEQEEENRTESKAEIPSEEKQNASEAQAAPHPVKNEIDAEIALLTPALLDAINKKNHAEINSLLEETSSAAADRIMKFLLKLMKFLPPETNLPIAPDLLLFSYYLTWEMGRRYEKGDVGVKQNPKIAVQIYTFLADRGFAPAQYQLGNCCLNSIGIKEDFPRALELFKLASNQGYAEAQYYMGWLHTEGQCYLGLINEVIHGNKEKILRLLGLYRLATDQGLVTQDNAEMIRLYQLAADQGLDCAQYSLGKCYEQGRGVEKNTEEAIRWYKLAYEQEYPHTESELTAYYIKGMGINPALKSALAGKNKKNALKTYLENAFKEGGDLKISAIHCDAVLQIKGIYYLSSLKQPSSQITPYALQATDIYLDFILTSKEIKKPANILYKFMKGFCQKAVLDLVSYIDTKDLLDLVCRDTLERFTKDVIERINELVSQNRLPEEKAKHFLTTILHTYYLEGKKLENRTGQSNQILAMKLYAFAASHAHSGAQIALETLQAKQQADSAEEIKKESKDDPASDALLAPSAPLISPRSLGVFEEQRRLSAACDSAKARDADGVGARNGEHQTALEHPAAVLAEDVSQEAQAMTKH